jgi:hypothetical protein
MVNAFCRAMKCSPGRARQIIPTFHWEGCSYITQVEKGEPCAFDAESGLGWCGDIFGGVGPKGAFMSGLAAGSLVAAFTTGSRKSVLPGEAEWNLREAREGDEDIVSVAGKETGRYEKDDGLDHTWETAERAGGGERVVKADSYAKVRKYGALGDERFSHKDGPWSAPAVSKDHSASKTQTAGGLLKLSCEKIDDGILKLTGMSPDVQSKLLRAVFPPGAQGVCGGLYDGRSGKIEVGRNKDWSVKDGAEVPWSELGLHGHHSVQMNELRGIIVEKVLNAIKKASPPEVLGDFSPDSIKVSFEMMHGRTIREGQTLCGWSKDGDRADDNDKSPKLCIILGSAKIWKGYKYRKEDRDSLDVDLSPGDVLVLYGPARTWVSAVNGFEPQKAPAPFDFAHVWIQDHRSLQQKRPDVYEKIHHPPQPVSGGNEYKWMQYAYTVLDKRASESDDQVMVEMSDGTSVKRERSTGNAHGQAKVARTVQVESEFQPPSRKGVGKGRRWESKSAAGDQHGHPDTIMGA